MSALIDIRQKIITLNDWQQIRQQLSNKRIVFTNGCFDVLHRGHAEYLAQAKDMGDCLVIGLNSDASVQRLKGLNRPINHENDRAFLLASLQVVDYIIVFEEDTPYNLISQVIPDILVKGGDYQPDQIVGADIVTQNGGTVQTIDFVDGYSSTKIINHLNH